MNKQCIISEHAEDNPQKIWLNLNTKSLLITNTLIYGHLTYNETFVNTPDEI